MFGLRRTTYLLSILPFLVLSISPSTQANPLNEPTTALDIPYDDSALNTRNLHLTEAVNITYYRVVELKWFTHRPESQLSEVLRNFTQGISDIATKAAAGTKEVLGAAIEFQYRNLRMLMKAVAGIIPWNVVIAVAAFVRWLVVTGVVGSIMLLLEVGIGTCLWVVFGNPVDNRFRMDDLDQLGVPNLDYGVWRRSAIL